MMDPFDSFVKKQVQDATIAAAAMSRDLDASIRATVDMASRTVATVPLELESLNSTVKLAETVVRDMHQQVVRNAAAYADYANSVRRQMESIAAVTRNLKYRW